MDMNNDFATTIEQWYAEHRRVLPWRDTRDPYLIWVSEIILQQTRVAQGFDYYTRFVHRFPTVQSLAEASEDEVLLLWQGLGYYSRARNMHRAAKAVAEMGSFPADYAALRELPGVGDYTAAAIASFAYDEPCAVLDGNVYRVLSRYLGVDTPIDSTVGKRMFRALADEMLDASHSALYNQAIMDFGAMVCTPHPLCESCPLSLTCDALRTGRTTDLPVKSRSLQVRTRHLVYLYVRVGQHILLHRRPTGDIWAGLYEPLLFEPSISQEDSSVMPSSPFASAAFADGKVPSDVTLLKQGMRHQLSHQLLLADFYVWNCPSRELLSDEWLRDNGYFWCAESERSSFATSRLVEQLYTMV